jgi:hypothetical protein
MILDLALSYTPPGSELSLTLATIRDATLLAAALDIAITEADANALRASNPVAANGFRVKAAYLRRCREQSPSRVGDPTEPQIRGDSHGGTSRELNVTGPHKKTNAPHGHR